MTAIRPTTIPSGSSLARYDDGHNYVDCFESTVPNDVPFDDFVTAFYQTPLFRVEALILSVLARRPSNNSEARDLATGASDRFAAWTVEDRSDATLLMRDMSGRTRSWFASETHQEGTRLRFGSIVTAVPDGQGQKRLGAVFALLLPFHKLYARALLWSAVRRIRRGRAA